MSDDNPFAYGGSLYHQQQALNEGAKALAWIEKAGYEKSKAARDAREKEAQHKKELREKEDQNQKELSGMRAISRLQNSANNATMDAANAALGVAVQAVKNLKEEITSLKAENARLKERIQGHGELDSVNTYVFGSCFLLYKASKELSIRYGAELGKTIEEVSKAASALKLGVLESQNDPSHCTNWEVQPLWDQPYKDTTVLKQLFKDAVKE